VQKRTYVSNYAHSDSHVWCMDTMDTDTSFRLYSNIHQCPLTKAVMYVPACMSALNLMSKDLTKMDLCEK